MGLATPSCSPERRGRSVSIHYGSTREGQQGLQLPKGRRHERIG